MHIGFKRFLDVANASRTLRLLRKELVPFTQLVKVRRGQLVLALTNIDFHETILVPFGPFWTTLDC